MSTIITAIPGLLIVGFLMGCIYKRDSVHWAYLEEAYGARLPEPLKERLGNLVLYGKFPVSKSYKGIVKVGSHRDGISLRIIFPIISYFCKPMFIPFGDIKGWKQTWYLDGESVELELANAPEVKLVMPRDQLQWISDTSGQSINVADTMSPNTDKPVFWYYFILVTGIGMPLMLGALFLHKYITG